MPALPHRPAGATLVLGAAMVLLGCDSKTTTAPPPGEHQAPAESEPPRLPVPEGETRPMLIEFSRDYCTPCQIMKPWVDEIAAEHPGVDVLTLNVDRQKYEHIGSFFQVTAVPSLVYVAADGQILQRSEGLAKKEEMVQALRELGWAE